MPRSERFTDRKTVTPLRKLLCELDVEALLTFLGRIGVPFTLSCHFRSRHRQLYECRIFIQERADSGEYRTVREYIATANEPKGNSARTVMANALARFLIGEQCDFHNLHPLVKEPPKEDDESEAVTE